MVWEREKRQMGGRKVRRRTNFGMRHKSIKVYNTISGKSKLNIARSY